MGAFFLAKGLSSTKLKEINEKFVSDGFVHYTQKRVGNYQLQLYRKILAPTVNYIEKESWFLGSTGTPIYKGFSYTQSLRYMLEDYINGRFQPDKLSGHYFLFLFNGFELKIIDDGSSILSAYHDTKGSFLSSSFLISADVSETLGLNRNAIVENLITGGIIGDETIFDEIKRFSRNSPALFPEIEFVSPVFGSNRGRAANKSEALDFQNDVLRDYFSKCKLLGEEYGVDTGLTGGLDSRLLLGHLRHNFKNIQVHSHSRIKPGKEWAIAKNIAETLGIKFVSPSVKSPESIPDNELLNTMERSFRFYDGQIRLHCNWDEEYNTLDYRVQVMGDKKLGFHGIGGEQYRNSDRLCFGSWNYRKWLKYKFLRRSSGKVFKNSKEEDDFLNRIRLKINGYLGFEKGKSRLTLLDLKRIRNEIQVPSFRGSRTNAENKIAFFLSPFADFQVSLAAYEVIPFLNYSNTPEIELIRRAAPDLCPFPTDYGYSLEKGEPFLKYFSKSFYENLIPDYIGWLLIDLLKRNRKGMGSKSRINSSDLLKRYYSNVFELNLPLRLDKLILKPDMAPLVFSMGFILEKYKTRIEEHEGDY